ncbi:ATP-binding protein [Peribacillus frigoritolerans]|uniref:ATP-binding protein n=1 Tax=Peribacillus frigoritolerans TaxID=450367 RepID=UPI003D059EED
MKPINLLSLLNARRSLTPAVFNSYISHFEIKIKDGELEDLRSLVEKLLKKIREVDIVEKFYVGYIINQIGKEFDLLRFGEKNIINIELKKENTGADRVKNQLIKNKYYLGFLDKKVLNFTYVAEDEKLFYLDESETLEEVEFTFLISELREQRLIEIEDIHKLFDPSNYLVSPFNSTKEFIENKYFLTDHQQVLKSGILKLDKETAPCFITLEGNAGTGKTLLTYDIAKEYKNSSKKVLIFHCGALNKGHIRLRDEYSWNIAQSKSHTKYNFGEYDLIILDETQRIDKEQINQILLKAKETNTKYIFSYDFQQCLASWEINRNIPQYIKEQVSPKHFKLTEKIRTNKEIASFIKNLFDLSKRNPNQEYPNIDVQYFMSSLAVKKELEILKSQGWKVINYTPSRYHKFPYDNFQNYQDESAHEVIGQEYDKVVAVLDQHFYYNQERKLSTQGWGANPYYHPTKMLFQMVTRARKKLHIIIDNNEAVLNECLNILHSNKK